MKSLAGKTVSNFGIDNRNIINYSFNKHGFRCDEFDSTTKKLVVVGGSISFGIGLDQSLTYAYKLAAQLNLHLCNMSFGCYRYENHDNLNNLKIMANSNCNDIFIIQVNNANRRRIDDQTVTIFNEKDFCISRLIDYVDQVNRILASKNKIFLYWDNENLDLPEALSKQFLVYNRFHVDHSIDTQSNTFGPKSHHAIFKVIYNRLSSQSVALKLIS